MHPRNTLPIETPGEPWTMSDAMTGWAPWVLDLDGGVAAQRCWLGAPTTTLDLRAWGPKIRLCCGMGTFRDFQRDLDAALADLVAPQSLLGGGLGCATIQDTPKRTWGCHHGDKQRRHATQLIFYGSGDFHHVSLALCRRVRGPFNLLVIDKHPDCMRRLPFLHCGNWLWHTCRLPNLQKVFHVGGDMDFDNGWRHLLPWREIRQGKIVVIPARRTFEVGQWKQVPHQPLRAEGQTPATPQRISELLRPHLADLAKCPLYISLDKDSMTAAQAVVNWDSSCLSLAEILAVLDDVVAAAPAVAGMDVVGDWSPPRIDGLLRRALAAIEHPHDKVDPATAQAVNEATNRALLEHLRVAWASCP